MGCVHAASGMQCARMSYIIDDENQPDMEPRPRVSGFAPSGAQPDTQTEPAGYTEYSLSDLSAARQLCATNLENPDKNFGQGLISFPSGSITFLMSKNATMFATASQIVASAKACPGQILTEQGSTLTRAGFSEGEGWAGCKGLPTTKPKDKATRKQVITALCVGVEEAFRPELLRIWKESRVPSHRPISARSSVFGPCTTDHST